MQHLRSRPTDRDADGLRGAERGLIDAGLPSQPYDCIQEVSEHARSGTVQIATNARRLKKPAFLFVNNRLEGNAPSTIEAVVEGL